MPKILVARKPFIIGVMGSHEDNHTVMNDARRLGEAIAERGYILLTGGGPGLMKVVSEGAYRAGGLVLGILPNERNYPLHEYPNEFVDIAIYTGMNDARNVINAKTPHVLVALSGGVGTLSEIALALRAGTPVIGLHCPSFAVPADSDFTAVNTVEEVLEEIDNILTRERKD